MLDASPAFLIGQKLWYNIKKEKAESRQSRHAEGERAITPREKYHEELQKFAFRDDTFIAAVFEYRPDVAEYIVRTLSGVSDLTLISVHARHDIHSVKNRSICCDLVAKDSAGKIYNIEIQRRRKGAEPERARFHSAMLDSSTLEKNADFVDLPETYVIFITEKDTLHGGKALYHIDRTVREMAHAPFGDRAHIIYAVMNNTSPGPLGQFLRDFLADEAARIADPALAECMNYFKTTEKGENQVCEIMERLIKKEKNETRWETQREIVLRMLNNGRNKEQILVDLGITDEEFSALLADKAG